MTHFLTALVAAAGVCVLSVPVSAQSYFDLRARAECEAVGATGAQMQSCINSYKRGVFLRNLGQALQQMGQPPQQQPYVLPQHQYDMLRDAERRRWEYNQRSCWLGNC